MRALIIDTETTGIEVPEPIELAWLEVDNDLLVVGEPFIERYKPSKPIELGAIATHHILPHELEGLPPSIDCEIPADVDFIIGHNVDYDWQVLGSPDIRRIDTLCMARKLWNKLDSHKLTALYYYTQGFTDVVRSKLKNAHSALHDVVFCHTLLEVMAREANLRTIKDIWVFSEEARIPEIMTFGKYKGRPVAEVDRGWQQWYRKTENPDPYVLMAFSRYCR